MKSRLFHLILISILVIGCDQNPDDYPGEPNVYGFLTVDSSRVQVMVGRTVSVTDTLPIDTIIDTFWYDDTTFDTWTSYNIPWNGVSGADVVLKYNDDSYVFTEHSDSAGYYHGTVPEPSAGQTWTFDITYPDGVDITARTTIPGDFEITGPEADTLLDTDTLRWTESPGAAGYQVFTKVWFTYDEEDTTIIDSLQSYPTLVPADTTYIPFISLRFYLWGDSAYFYVASLDTNAYDYKYYGENMWYDYDLNIADFMHIDGAWGMFGSKNIVKSNLYILPEPDTLWPEHR